MRVVRSTGEWSRRDPAAGLVDGVREILAGVRNRGDEARLLAEAFRVEPVDSSSISHASIASSRNRR